MRLRTGDRVVISSKGHPHYGEAGEIEGPANSRWERLGLDWVVDLDSGISCGAANEELAVP